MIGNTNKPRSQITEQVFDSFKKLYLDAHLGAEGLAAKQRFDELKSTAKPLEDRKRRLLEQQSAVYDACFNHKQAVQKGIECAFSNFAAIHAPVFATLQDAGQNAQQISRPILTFLCSKVENQEIYNIQSGLHVAGIEILNAMNGAETKPEDYNKILNLEDWTKIIDKFYEQSFLLEEYTTVYEKLLPFYGSFDEQKNIVMQNITAPEKRSKNPQDDLPKIAVEDLQTKGLLNDYNTFTPIIASLIDQYGFDQVTFELFEEYCKGHPPLPQATGLFQQPQSITANKEEDPENQMLHHDYPSGYQQAPPLDDEGHTESEPQYMTEGIKAPGKLQNASKAIKRVAKSAGYALRNFVSRNKGYRISEDMESAQVYAEGKPGAPKTRSRINPIKELLPEVSESSSISKAGLATSAGALIGFALLATSIGIAASIAAGRAPFLAQTPILSQNPFILTALMPAILGAITLALIVAAIARMRTNKDITLEFSLGHIAQADAMLLEGFNIRCLADGFTPAQCDRISQQTSSELLQAIKNVLEWEIQGFVGIEQALSQREYAPKIKVVSLFYSGSEHGERLVSSDNKLVITLRAGSMSEKQAWLDLIAKCTPAQSHPESLHHRRHYSDTDPSFVGGEPTGHNGPPALIAKTTKVAIDTTNNPRGFLLDAVKTALNNCQQALIDASNKSKKEPSSIMSEHSISSPTASEQHRSN